MYHFLQNANSEKKELVTRPGGANPKAMATRARDPENAITLIILKTSDYLATIKQAMT